MFSVYLKLFVVLSQGRNFLWEAIRPRFEYKQQSLKCSYVVALVFAKCNYFSRLMLLCWCMWRTTPYQDTNWSRTERHCHPAHSLIVNLSNYIDVVWDLLTYTCFLTFLGALTALYLSLLLGGWNWKQTSIIWGEPQSPPETQTPNAMSPAVYKKWRILMFCNKTESHLTVLQQNNVEAC